MNATTQKTASDEFSIFVEKALSSAYARRGFCSPNPSVGAVVFKDGELLGEGCHWKAGMPHAEVMALADLTPDETEGATMYVTLEPCSHAGKTPPCTDLLIKHKLKAVYYGLKDPNPLVSGNGELALKDAGIVCEHIPENKVTSFYQSYIWWTEKRLPWVTGKIALSLDGKSAGPKGKRVKITGEKANAYTHYCRKRSDGILTTAKTIINDDPELNVRIDGEVIPKPVYILDSRLETPLSARIFDTAERVCLFHSPEVSDKAKSYLVEHAAHCVPITLKDDKLSLNEVMAHIGEEGTQDLWVEAGGTCFQSLLDEKLMHHALVYVAPKTLGKNALSAFSGNKNVFEDMRQLTWRQFGQDVICEMFPFQE